MDTIKYVQVLSVIVLITVTIKKTLCWNVEGYLEYESVDKGLGLPLSALKTITFRENVSYSEFDESKIRQLLSSIVDVVFWGQVGKTVNDLQVDENQLITKFSKKLLEDINRKLDKNDKQFNIIKQNIVSKNHTTSKEYIISSNHIIYREGKMYGFVLNVQSLWTNPGLELKGLVVVEPSGIIMEADILMLKNENQSKYRDYGDSLSFIQSEAIMKDKSYEDKVSQKQAYGLLQDRGISSKSFSSS
jgi:hypothetical protein